MLLKFAGFFVEKVPVEGPAQPGQTAGQQQAMQPASGTVASPPLTGAPMPMQSSGAVTPAAPAQYSGPAPTAVPVALRAWVPQEYASYLAQFGLHVIAAGGELSADQARAYGAYALIISAECLGADTHLLVSPQLPTVFVTPQPVSLPEGGGVMQVQEPLRASEMAIAVREAIDAWNARASRP